MQTRWWIHILIVLLTACGGEGNLADCEEGQAGIPCTERGSEEDARLALDRGDYEAAIPILRDLVAAEPEEYRRYPLLAAALAASAGVSIRDLASATTSAGEEGEGDFLDQTKAYLPDPSEYGDDAAYEAIVVRMKEAVDTLTAIPAALRAETSAEEYASSARFQLTLYQSAYSVMYLNQFTVNAVSGELDAEKLANMTEEEAIAVLQNFAALAATQAGGEDAEVAAQVNALLQDINAQEGSGNKEKLIEYLSQNEEGTE